MAVMVVEITPPAGDYLGIEFLLVAGDRAEGWWINMGDHPPPPSIEWEIESAKFLRDNALGHDDDEF